VSEDLEHRAVEIAAEIVAARVSAAAGRPTGAEGRDAAAYFDEVLGAVRSGLGLPPLTPPQ
jgi:hypothetical protein